MFDRVRRALKESRTSPMPCCLAPAPAPLAYRIFRDGGALVESDHAALVARKARVVHIATVRDAGARVRDLPPSLEVLQPFRRRE